MYGVPNTHISFVAAHILYGTVHSTQPKQLPDLGEVYPHFRLSVAARVVIPTSYCCHLHI